MTRLLAVDDEPKIVAFISRALGAAGFQIDGASDGAEGLALALEGHYALVILDLMLPGLDGLSMLQELMAVHPEQPILVLSALSDVDTRVKCLDCGAVDFMAKPFAIAELVARVRARLRGSHMPVDGRYLRSGGISLDLQRREFQRGARTVALSEREFMVLRHLMLRAGQVCSRTELLRDVWGYSFEPSTNVLEVLIARLRAKIGGGYIETVRNVGYVFDAPADTDQRTVASSVTA